MCPGPWGVISLAPQKLVGDGEGGGETLLDPPTLVHSRAQTPCMNRESIVLPKRKCVPWDNRQMLIIRKSGIARNKAWSERSDANKAQGMHFSCLLVSLAPQGDVMATHLGRNKVWETHGFQWMAR
ncbi:hypothetical protein RRG08_043487 [Elysia crispata]|uniref:Uncharacterized protein n=1 Tax=Elysia crispata TaxID=231223 RepID=A0AAE0YFU1_9GAST|nr:hypothetical protein RRG08_043487 [Elysia crispata]